MKIIPHKLGLACGAVGIIMYLGCMGLMAIAGEQGTVWFFNAILHGFDTSDSIRMNVPITETLTGIALTGILGTFCGWLIGVVYNRL